MKYKYFYIIFTIITLAVSSCDNCEECGEPGNPPSIRIKFFPRSHVRALDQILTQYNTDLRHYNDSIRDSETKEDTLKYQDLRAQLQKKVDSVSNKRSDFNRNIVTIDSIKALGINRLYNNLTDSTANLFRLPFNMQSDSSKFIIYLKDRSLSNGDTLTFYYDVSVSPRDQNIKVIADNLRISTTTFDSLTTECKGAIEQFRTNNKQTVDRINTNCTSNETTLNIYY